MNIIGKVYYVSGIGQYAGDGDAILSSDIGVKKVPIPGIEVELVNSGDKVVTDLNGAYIINVEKVSIGEDNAVVLIFTDTDGEANGGTFAQLRLVKDNIVWYNNHANITLDAQMSLVSPVVN